MMKADLFLQLLLAIPQFAFSLARALPAEGWRHCWKRLPLFLALWLAFAVLNLLHLVGHLLDELLFRSYRRVRLRKPVFIIGLPRSGTTLLQRAFAEDPQVSSFRTWEALFAPSLSERYFYRGLGLLLRPLARLGRPAAGAAFKPLQGIHQTGLLEPEEDFLLLLPLQACFLAAFICPNSARYWQLANFDQDCSPAHRRRIMAYYRLSLQKHLHYHGPEKRLVSKNASFPGWLESLRDAFPEACFIACTRPPTQVAPSQLSALRPAMRLLGSGACQPATQEKMLAALRRWYGIIQQQAKSNSLVALPMEKVKNELKQTMLGLYQAIHLPCPRQCREKLESLAEAARSFRGDHAYEAGEFGLTEDAIEGQFHGLFPIADTLPQGGPETHCEQPQ